MTKKYKVKILRDVCIGAANCVAIAPDAFELDEEQIAVLKETWTEESESKLLEAAEACPVAAIIIEDENGNQIFPSEKTLAP